jgi:hypothetical protein
MNTIPGWSLTRVGCVRYGAAVGLAAAGWAAMVGHVRRKEREKKKGEWAIRGEEAQEGLGNCKTFLFS